MGGNPVRRMFHARRKYYLEQGYSNLQAKRMARRDVNEHFNLG